jgi:DNA-binding transcriptional MerR regulator
MGATSPFERALDSAGELLHTHQPASGRPAGEMTIGEMARAFGVTLRTLRFYEDRNLIHPRREGNARYYGGPDRVRLEMILKGKQLGFTLAEINELIGAENKPASADFEEKLQPAQIANQIDHLERQRRDIDEAILSLKATHERLSRSIKVA